MFRSVVLGRIARRTFEMSHERKNTIAGIQNIIRNSLTEFDKGAEEYRIFRETNDTPDWGVVRMSSIAMSHRRFEEAELFLRQQMEEYGGASRRQARNVDVSDEQVCASIDRVLRKDETAESAFQFFEFLKKYKFCTNRDVFVKVLIQFTVEKYGWREGLKRLQVLLKDDKRAKNMKMSLFFILEDAWKNGKSEEAENLISKMEGVKPSTLRSLQLFIRFTELSGIESADYCKRNSISFSHDDVMFFIEMAGKLKYPQPLLRFLEVNRFVPIPKSSIFPLFDELIKLAGKSGKTENLEEMMWKVKANRDLSDGEKSILYGKLRHFYKCLNEKAPEKLYILMSNND
uniref:Pentatricopeptide repeat-containing protein n=1 Tax=Caenorhabditis tropicalis TaxID=1561998 RepID=A0A1I7UVF9_9PELO